jgi:methanogenic corrinoid protein MtbC1
MQENKISLAQGYMSGKIAEDILLKAAEEWKQIKSIKGERKIVIGNIEDDYHSLGRRLVSTFLSASGWEVYDLGNDILAKEFVDKALETGSSVIAVSAMMYTNAKNIIKVRDEIEKRNLGNKIKLAIGGAIFNLRPELIKEVGGDGHANNAITAVELCESLYQKTQNQ